MFTLLCASTAMAAQDTTSAARPSASPARTLSSVRTTAAASHARIAALRYLEGLLRRYEEKTWYWQRLSGSTLSQTAGRTLSAMAVSDLKKTVSRWERRAVKAHRVAQHPPHFRQWMCIHHYEGAWNDVGGPYWGGLQMSLGFQETYGGWIFRKKGTADHWTPLEQIWTAEKALKSRGFWPWPNTARLCGLL